MVWYDTAWITFNGDTLVLDVGEHRATLYTHETPRYLRTRVGNVKGTLSHSWVIFQMWVNVFCNCMFM